LILALVIGIYFGQDGDQVIVLLGGGTKKRQHQPGYRKMARLQTTEETREKVMALTRDFKVTVRARVQRDPALRRELLREGVESFLAGDMDTGKSVLRDYINATIGFHELAEITQRSPKSLMRMLGPAGNPYARNFFEIVSCLQKKAGVHFELKAFAARAGTKAP
jgi:hypothetical protein